MKKFLVTAHAPDDHVAKMHSQTPEETKAVMDAWMAWAEEVGAALIDLGAPVMHGKKLTPGGVEDSTRDIRGYMFMQAESVEEIVEMLKSNPHLSAGDSCDMEIHEVIPVQM